jgi:excisionase family DNA binding protein
MPESEQLLTSSEVGALLGKSARTVSRLAQSGDLPHAARLAAGNGLYLFRRGDVDKYLAEREAQANA